MIIIGFCRRIEARDFNTDDAPLHQVSFVKTGQDGDPSRIWNRTLIRKDPLQMKLLLGDRTIPELLRSDSFTSDIVDYENIYHSDRFDDDAIRIRSYPSECPQIAADIVAVNMDHVYLYDLDEEEWICDRKTAEWIILDRSN